MYRHLSLLTLCSVLTAVTGCTTVIREPEVVHTAPQHAAIRHPPSLIQEVRSPAPGQGYGWVQGHWLWQNNQWVWQTGHWYQGSVRPMPPVIVEQSTIAPSPAHFWVTGQWFWRDGEWSWRNGHWSQ